MIDQLKKDLVATGYPGGWWYDGPVRDSANGWPQIYAQSRYHCVYCRKDISVSLDEIAASTTDHVVPQRLFPEEGAHDKGPNHINNLVTACAVCNSIKGGWAPEPSSPGWNSRKAFIEEARKYIGAERTARANRYKDHIGEGKRLVEIWDWTRPGEGDFA